MGRLVDPLDVGACEWLSSSARYEQKGGPLLPFEHPTGIPYSDIGSKCLVLPVGFTKVTGHPKGNRNLVFKSGAVPVISSWLDAKFSIEGVLCGLQLAVSTMTRLRSTT